MSGSTIEMLALFSPLALLGASGLIGACWLTRKEKRKRQQARAQQLLSRLYRDTA
jgi:cytochrome bd-type quinol oxidase subunit 2